MEYCYIVTDKADKLLHVKASLKQAVQSAVASEGLGVNYLETLKFIKANSKVRYVKPKTKETIFTITRWRVRG